jgi:hypothetical protein
MLASARMVPFIACHDSGDSLIIDTRVAHRYAPVWLCTRANWRSIFHAFMSFNKSISTASILNLCFLRKNQRQIPRQNCPHIFLRRGRTKVPEKLACDCRENEKGAADESEDQTHKPEMTFLCKRRDCRDGNRDLKHGHPAREHFVLVEV